MKTQESMILNRKDILDFYPRVWSTMGVLLLTFLACIPGAEAQCDGQALACNNLVQVSLDTTCTALITPDVVLEDPQGDESFYEVRVYDPNGDTIPGDLITQDYDNQKLEVRVYCRASGIYCWGYIWVEDKIKPSISVSPRDTAVSCYQFDFEFDPNEFVDTIAFSDNGCEKPTLDPVVDIVQELDNCADTIRIITRLFTARDAAGNTCTDTQYIHVLRADITEIEFPRDTVVDCLDEADLSIEKLGQPEERSCNNFMITHEDIEIKICGEAKKILRVWRVTDTCNNQDTTHTQVIKVEDNYPPEFDFSFFEIPIDRLVPNKHDCSATAVDIPNPIITDCNLAQTTLEVFYQLVDENGDHLK